jgi:hypothetical protein
MAAHQIRSYRVRKAAQAGTETGTQHPALSALLLRCPMLDYIYITEVRAREVGLTHKGTLFGVPAWFAEDDGEVCMATPKVPLLHIWCWFADKCFDVAANFTPADMVLVSPITITGRI